MSNPTKRACLVTGGVRGIGREIVQQLVARGDTVFVFDVIDTYAPEVEALSAAGVGYCVVDVRSKNSIDNGFCALDSWLQHQGACGLSLVVNNAGITRDNLALRMSLDDWQSVLDINLTGAFLCSQYALKRMIRQSISYIISISSIVGRTGNKGQVNYAAAKAGLNAMTKTLALEYASRNILVNAIAPGFIATAMTDTLSEQVRDGIKAMIPLQRMGTPADVASVVCFLSSGNADYITGQVIEVSGGLV